MILLKFAKHGFEWAISAFILYVGFILITPCLHSIGTAAMAEAMAQDSDSETVRLPVRYSFSVRPQSSDRVA